MRREGGEGWSEGRERGGKEEGGWREGGRDRGKSLAADWLFV